MSILTVEEEKILFRVFNRVWNEIASDVMALEERSSVPRDEVLEMVLDCDRPLRAVQDAHERALVCFFNALPPEEQKKLARRAFPSKHYG